MANTATSFLIDTLGGTSTKQTGHPEFELSEPLNYSPFTIELWYQHGYTGWSDWSTLVNITNTTAGTDNTTVSTAGSDFYLMAQYGSGNNYYGAHIYATDGTGGGEWNSSSYNNGNIIRNEQWHHVAVTRQFNGFCGVWHDGLLIGGSGTVASKDRILPGKRVELGFNRVDSGNYMFTGYMDEFRISKKVRYGNIDMPTTFVSSTQTSGIGKNALRPEHVSFLIQSNSTVTTSDTIVDRTGKNSLTISGASYNAAVAARNFGNCGIYFDGASNHYIEVPRNADYFDVSDGQDFSYECWFKRVATSQGNHAHFLSISADSSDGMYLAYRDSNHDIQFACNGTNDLSIYAYPDGTASAGQMMQQWNHIVCGKVNGQNFIMLNGQLAAHGVQEGSGFDLDGTAVIRIGRGAGPGWQGQYFEGYMDGMRFCKGQSAYTPHFTPYGGLKNIVHNRGGAVTDARHASANTHAIQTGRAAIGSDAATNANTYCLDFDGTGGSPKGDHYVSYGKDRFESNSKFSIFGWIYVDAVSGTEGNSILFGSDSGDGNKWWSLWLNTSGYLQFYSRNGSPQSIVTASSGQFTGGTLAVWKSIGVTHDGTTTTLYVDGTSVGSGSQEGWDYGSGNLNIFTIGATNKSATANADVEAEFDGKMIGLAMWSGTVGSLGVLTAAQISALHSAGKSHDLTTATGVYTASEIDDLAAYWRFGNHYLDTTETLHDVSGNGHDVHAINTGTALTYTTGTTFLNNWQHRGYFTPDKYTSLLIQSSTNEGATSFQDTGPGFKRVAFDGTDDVAIVSSLGSYRSSDSQGSLNLWVKPAVGGAFQTMLLVTDSASTSYYLNFRISSGNKLQLIVQWDGSNSVSFEQSGTVSFGAWHMYTITCDTNGYKLYIDGSEDTSALMTTEYGDNSWWFNDFTSTKANRISLGAGAYNSTMHYFTGLMSQVGIWGGSSGTTGVLSASEISAIYALGPDGNVKTDYSTGLVDYWTFGNQIGEGTDTASTIYSQVAGGNDLTTSGTMAAPFAGHTLTATGTSMTHSTAKSVFGGSSMSFDGSDDYITASPSHDFNFGTGPFTIEGWINSDIANNGAWLSTRNHSDSHIELFTYSSGQYITAYLYDSGSGSDVDINAFATYVTGQWYHVALVREGTGTNETHFYVDGILKHSSTYAADLNHSGGADLMIGAQPADGSPPPTSWAFNGYLDEIRMSSGIARYKKSIERFANTFVAKGDTGDAFTQLLLQSNGIRNGGGVSKNVNFSGTLLDSGTPYSTIGDPLWLNRVGDGFGGANTALYFDGESALKFDDHAVLDYGTKDFTWEAWFNIDKAQDGMIIGQSASPWNDNFRNLYYDTSENSVYFAYEYHDGSTKYGYVYNPVNSKTYINLEKWYHVAVVNKPSARLSEMYINGVLECANTASGTYNTATSGNPPGAGNFYIGATEVSGTRSSFFYGFLDQVRISDVARYGGIQLRTTQQTHVSANSDSGVITSNSTFGSANNIFETDGHTVMLLNGDELYANTLVVSGAHTFHRNVGGNNVSNVTTTFATSVQANVERVGGTTGNVYTINGALRPTDLVLVRDNHYIFHISDSNYSSHPLKFSTTSGGTHSPGGTEYTTGITVDQTTQTSNTLIKFSPTSATPDTLYYYCSSHNLMGGQITVTDSTGSDGKIATQPFAMFKGDGTAAAGGPTQRQGVSAYGANSYFFDGTDLLRSTQAMVGGGTTKGDNFDFGKENFTIEYWEYPIVAASDHNWAIAGGGPAAQRVFEGYYYANNRFNLVYGLGGTTEGNFNSHLTEPDKWAHIAIQGRWNKGSGNIEVWKNGQLQNTSPTITTALNSLSTIGSGSPALYLGGLYASTGAYQGYFDSFRISKGIARYGYSGTNIKLGTNAVHHSHCKLLITSNTFSGNTHFDDFSDQGNYWNQQPLSYYGNGTGQYIQGGKGIDDANYSIASWIKWDGTYTGSYNTIWDSRNPQGLVLTIYESSASGHQIFLAGSSLDGTSPDRYGADMRQYKNQWTLVTTTWTSYSSNSPINVYLNADSTPTIAGTLTSADYRSNDRNVRFGGDEDAGARCINGNQGQCGIWEGRILTTSEIADLWALGPAGNWTTSFSTNLVAYYAVGNHNTLAGRPADDATNVYDRSGNDNDGTAEGSMTAPNKGTNIIGGTTSKHSTDVSNFGSSAIKFDGTTNSALKLPQDTFRIKANENFTFEAWCYRIGASNATVFDTRASGTNYIQVGDQSGRPYIWVSGGNFSAPSSDDYAMSGKGWFHYVLQRNNGQLQMLINGKLAIDSSNTNELGPAGNYAWIGAYGTSSVTGEPWNGYLDELAFYEGVAKYNPVATGLGTATITPSYLSDPTGNHFTSTNFAITDQMLDTPENNFCTLNPLKKGPDFTFSEGNLAAALGGSNKHGHCQSTFAVRKGKWYWEAKITSSSPDSQGIGINGVDNISDVNTGHQLSQADAYTTSNSYSYFVTGSKYVKNTEDTSWGDTFTAAGSVIGVAMDFSGTTGKLDFYKDGELQGGTGDPSGFHVDDIPLDVDYTPAISLYTGDSWHVNFGQGDPDGENNFTDGNGQGGFRYEPPQGYLSLCTANLKDIDFAPIGPNSGKGTPDKHFDTLLYTGDGTADRRIGGLNFQPDFVWIKPRDITDNHVWCSSLQGELKALYSNSTAAEVTNGVLSFNSDGFTVGDWNNINDDGDDFVAWCWKAGNETTINNDGTIQTTVSANRDAGFSIVSYTSNGSAGATIGHGLDSAPEMIIGKNRDRTYHWGIYNKANGVANGLRFTTDANLGGFLNNTEPSSSVITLGTYDLNMESGDNQIMYCWHSVEGYSKFGTYVGNSNVNGPFIYLGFKPAWVMIKCSTSAESGYASWIIQDNKRTPNNPIAHNTGVLYAESSRKEGHRPGGGDSASSEVTIDMLSNGFKVRNSSHELGQSQTYIYMAFAEMPFKYANAR